VRGWRTPVLSAALLALLAVCNFQVLQTWSLSASCRVMVLMAFVAVTSQTCYDISVIIQFILIFLSGTPAFFQSGPFINRPASSLPYTKGSPSWRRWKPLDEIMFHPAKPMHP